MIFGAGAPSRPASSSRTPMQAFDVDDSQQGREIDESSVPNWRQVRCCVPYYFDAHSIQIPYLQGPVAASNANPYRSSPILSLLSYPFHILSSVFRFIFSILRIPIPHFPFLSLNFYRPIRPRRTASSGGGGPDRWVRELEEETGAVCIGSSRQAAQGITSGVAGPSTLTARASSAAVHDDARKFLPDFTLGSYEETLRLCQKEHRIGCIILVSEEHDDVAEFKRSTLTDPELIQILSENDFLVWGGDVRDLEAHTAGEKLQATTYPFVAFVALQPTRAVRPTASSSNASGATPTMTVLSRHQGATATTATALSTHLTNNLLPRVTPYLGRLRASKVALEHERALRQQQDQAFADSARRDTERILQKRAADQKEREERKKREEEERRVALAEEERQIAEAIQREKREAEQMQWRRYLRRALVKDTEAEDAKLRIAIRLPNGTRVIRRFGEEETLTVLYTFVDAQFLPEGMRREDDPKFSPPSSLAGAGNLEERVSQVMKQQGLWDFKLVNAYPRKEIPWAVGVRLGEVESLRGGGAQLVVEMDVKQNGNGKGKGKADEAEVDGDGYDTESDEE